MYLWTHTHTHTNTHTHTHSLTHTHTHLIHESVLCWQAANPQGTLSMRAFAYYDLWLKFKVEGAGVGEHYVGLKWKSGTLRTPKTYLKNMPLCPYLENL